MRMEKCSVKIQIQDVGRVPSVSVIYMRTAVFLE